MRSVHGTGSQTVSRSSGSITKRRIHWMALARIGRKAISPACAVEKQDTATISLGRSCCGSRKRPRGGRTTAASAMEIRATVFSVTPCVAASRWILAVTGSGMFRQRSADLAGGPGGAVAAVDMLADFAGKDCSQQNDKAYALNPRQNGCVYSE